MATFEYGKSSANGKYNFRLKDNNNEIILHSNQGYENEQGCKDGIASVKKRAATDYNYTRYLGRNNLYYFAIRASNGRVIAQSEGYASASSRNEGVENCKEEAPKAYAEKIFAY